MSLSHWLGKAGISQRELARRVGYSSNGMISKILKNEAYVPQDQIPQWADALELKGDDRAKFIEECSQKAIPDWTREQIEQLRARAREAERLLLPLETIVCPPDPEMHDAIRRWAMEQDKSTLINLLIATLAANLRMAGMVKGSPSATKISQLLAREWTSSRIAAALELVRETYGSPPGSGDAEPEGDQ